MVGGPAAAAVVARADLSPPETAATGSPRPAQDARERRVIAVDWSGDRRVEDRHDHEKLWFAEVVDGALERVEPSSRREVIAHIIDAARRTGELVVGLDFSFSYPGWFLAEHDLSTAQDLWRAMGTEALPFDAPPFWGWATSRKPLDKELLRATERAAGGGLKSAFQLAGAGAVGTGSRTGMPHLAVLSAAGFRIWPFDDVASRRPLAVEIYPRRFTGPVVKSRFSDRRRWWERAELDVDDAMLVAAALASEDAFDATVSALRMAERYDELRTLPATTRHRIRVEGWIFGVPLPDPLEASP